MYGQIVSAVIVALIQLLPPAQTYILRSPSSTPSQPQPQPQPHSILPLSVSSQACPSRTTPKSFSLSEITYLRYETSQYTSPAPPNTTQLVFEITNPATGISTGCALQTVMSPSGDWIDDDETWWYTCLERTITIDDDDDGKKKYPVKTSARFDWDEWRLTVNQTWVCEESVTISQFSTLTLAPICTENKTGSQYIKECTAPDIVVAATSGDIGL